MSKTKNKTRTEAEHYRGIIREYEKEIKSLRQQLRQYEKYSRSQDSSENSGYDNEDTFVEKKLIKSCDNCGKGTVIETLEILGKIYGTCDTCGYNERMNK